MRLDGLRLGIYRIGRELGRGGMGSVYRARTEAEGPAGPAGSDVAVKVFHAHLVDDAHAFERFEREAKVGMRIRHPRVVRTYEIGREEVDGKPVHFLAMELVEGQTLADLRRELGTVPENLRVQIADQVLDALDAVHACGIVHRDVKPENLVITPDHRVLLMDLGVARLLEKGHTLTQTGDFVGSLAFAAPEQFLGEEVGPRADLYAFGIVLFELATGTNPFDVANLPALVETKLRGSPPSPHSLNADVDAFWSDFILTAARSRAADRFESAAQMRAILRDGEASAWWRERRERVAASPAEAALKRLRVEREVPFVGRYEALNALELAWKRGQKEGRSVLVSGPSGIGKSRLVSEFLGALAAESGVRVAAGRCVGAGGRSYQPFVEAFEDLLVAREAAPTERRAALETRLKGLLADTPGVVSAFADFLLGGMQSGGESTLSKDALMASMARVVERLASETPLLLVIEDLHWAGAESVDLFQYLARCVVGRPVLLVGIASDDEVDESTPIHALAPGAAIDVERIALGPLPEAAVEALVRAVVRTERTVRALARPLGERSDGNPFLVLEMLGLLRSGGALVARGEGLELAKPLDDLAIPASVRDVVATRLGRLDDEQRETLEAAAILGYEFDAPLLASVLGENRIALLKRLAVLERRSRLVIGSGKSGFRFASRRVFETVYAAIAPALRREYHGLVADTLLASVASAGAATPEPAVASALLKHLLEAERAPEAEPHLEAALADVAARFHASYAAPFLERVRAAFHHAAPAKQFAIAMRLWTAYELLGSRADQMRVLDDARALADRMGDPEPRSRVHALRAGSYWYAGEYEQAAGEARTALALAVEAGDRRGEATCHHTLGAVAWRRGEPDAAASELREALRIRREVGDRRGEASTLQALALVLPATGNEEEVLPTMEEALRIWREVGERRGEAAVQMNIGNRLVDLARFDEGRALLERAIAGHRETGALASEGMALANLGHADEVLGRFDAARESWTRALGLFVDLGDPNGEATVRTMLGAALGANGAPEEGRRHLAAAIELAEKKGAKSKLSNAHRELGVLLHRTSGRAEAWEHFDRALALDREARNVIGRVATLSAMGWAALLEGSVDRAAEFLNEALPDARKGAFGPAALLLARLAAVRRAAGHVAEAESLARESLARVETAGAVSAADAPELFATLGEILDGGARREEFLARAGAIVAERARHIRDTAVREEFLRQSRAGRPSPAAAGDAT